MIPDKPQFKGEKPALKPFQMILGLRMVRPKGQSETENRQWPAGLGIREKFSQFFLRQLAALRR